MDFSEVNRIINEMSTEIANLRAQYQEKLQEQVKNLTTAFFETYPEVQAVIWAQYTPYFNDGEPCEFSVNDPVFITKNFDPEDLLSPYEYEDDETYGTVEFGGWRSRNKEKTSLEAACAEFAHVIMSNDDLMLAAFDDHVAVYLTKDQVYVNEYQHD